MYPLSVERTDLGRGRICLYGHPLGRDAMTPFATDIIESQLEDATCRPILEAEVAMLRNEASTRPPDWMFEDLRDADTDEGRAIAIEVLLRAALGVRANKGNPLQEEK